MGPAPPAVVVVVFEVTSVVDFVDVGDVVSVVFVVGEPPPLPAEVVGLLPTPQVDSQAAQAPPALLVEPPEYTIPI